MVANIQQTRWGVGFGPRDCSDYQSGISVIPISKLTDADRKWMLTAEYGGSGGQSIESGMVVEEPDIEIGQGVSSKAISRRMQTDKGGNNGPKSTRDRDEEEGSRFRRHDRDDRRDTDRQDRFSKVSAPPSMPAVPPFGMPGFPFTMPTLPNGMPMFPPGFPFPGQTPTQPPQPPPPGRS
jgi:protein NRD1